MSGDNDIAPIIIKRKKVSGGDGHHGGAWKVAYADFVTAMMAFFLLMWLLNATTETQRKGLADYFAPTIPINRISGGGDGAFGGNSVFSEDTLPQNGTGGLPVTPLQAGQQRAAENPPGSGPADGSKNTSLAELEAALLGGGGESFVDDNAYDHVITRVTDEGLVVELFETESGRLFDELDAPTVLFRDLLLLISEVGKLVDNPLAVEGHVPASPIVIADDQSWDHSTERAHSVRDWLIELGFPGERMNRVTGHADREPSVDNRMDIRNSRVEIIFLRQ